MNAMNRRVDVRLTANLQLRPCHNPPGGSVPDPDEPAPRFDHLVRAPRIPGGASIESPAAPCFPSAALSATGEHVAPPLTPLVATAPFEPDLSIRPALATARIRLHPCLVKGNGFFAPGTPSLDECSLRASPPSDLGSRLGQTMGHRIIESPPPYPRLRHAARPRPASNALFVGEGSRASPALASGLDPASSVAGGLVGPDASRRLLQSEQPTSTTTNLPIPGPNAPTWLAQLALNRRGGGPIRRIDIRIRVTPLLPPRRGPCGPRSELPPGVSRAIPSQGPAGHALRRLSLCPPPRPRPRAFASGPWHPRSASRPSRGSLASCKVRCQ